MGTLAFRYARPLFLSYALMGLGTPVEARFRGMLGSLGGSSDKTTSRRPYGKSRSAKPQVLGSPIGSVAGTAASRAGGAFTLVPISGLTYQLTAATASKLDPEEQKQAAEATLEATRGIGDAAEVAVESSASWTSGTRDQVSGTSTVVALDG